MVSPDVRYQKLVESAFTPRFSPIQTMNVFADFIRAGREGPKQKYTSRRRHELQLSSSHAYYPTKIEVYSEDLLGNDTNKTIEVPRGSAFVTEKDTTLYVSQRDLVRDANTVLFLIVTGLDGKPRASDIIADSVRSRLLEKSDMPLPLIFEEGIRSSITTIFDRFESYRPDLIPALAASFVVAAEDGLEVIHNDQLGLQFGAAQTHITDQQPYDPSIHVPESSFRNIRDRETHQNLGKLITEEQGKNSFVTECPYKPFARAFTSEITQSLSLIQQKVLSGELTLPQLWIYSIHGELESAVTPTIEQHAKSIVMRKYDHLVEQQRINSWKEMRKPWRDDAKAIFNFGTGVIVNAPHKSGKTTFLVPELIEEAKQNGLAVGFIDKPYELEQFSGRKLESAYSNVPRLDEKSGRIILDGDSQTIIHGQKSILIIDEPARIVEELGVEPFARVMQDLEEQNVIPIILNAWHTRDAREAFSQALISATGIDASQTPFFTSYEMSHIHVFPQAVNTYLEVLGVSQDIRAFFTADGNEALLTPGMLGALERRLIIDDFNVDPIRTLSELAEYLTKEADRFAYPHSLGGSRDSFVNMIINLGLVNATSFRQHAANYRDYN